MPTNALLIPSLTHIPRTTIESWKDSFIWNVYFPSIISLLHSFSPKLISTQTHSQLTHTNPIYTTTFNSNQPIPSTKIMNNHAPFVSSFAFGGTSYFFFPPPASRRGKLFVSTSTPLQSSEHPKQQQHLHLREIEIFSSGLRRSVIQWERNPPSD